MRGAVWIRNHRVAWALAALVLIFAAGSVRAEESAVAKAAAWKIGDQLSLAGLLYSQGGEGGCSRSCSTA